MLRNRYGIEPIDIMITEIRRGMNLFLNLYIIRLYTNKENSRDAIYETRGVSAMGSGVGLSSDLSKPVTLIK